MKKRIFLILTVLFVSFRLFSQSNWQGKADVSKFGELPERGYYAASNDFPRDTKVSVTNNNNGKKVVVSILNELPNEPGLLLLLSPEAAKALDMGGQQIPISVAVDRSNIDRQSFLYEDGNINPDPEVNPVAVNTGDTSNQNKEDSPSEDNTDAVVATIESAEQVIEEAAANAEESDQPDFVEPEQLEAPQSVPDLAGDDVVLPELAESVPEKDSVNDKLAVSGIFPQEDSSLKTNEEAPDKIWDLPGREDAFYNRPEPEVLPTEQEVDKVVSELDTPEVVQSEIVPEDSSSAPADVALLPALPVEEEKPEISSAQVLEVPEEDNLDTPLLPETPDNGTEESSQDRITPPEEFPIENPDDVVITLEPGNLRPPENTPIEDPEPVVTAVPEPVKLSQIVNNLNLATISSLDPKMNYIQIGSYKENIQRENLVSDLQSIMPIAILKKPEDPQLIRLVAGPLSEDQIGVLYYLIKDKGFKDSFIIRRKE
ncbi:hypothetical protein [Spirochaeta cellobiosiphila]|uniref:hypothetical protein n=1 Tax=Spirochaeta cellobiosiphila TaxID=504483 RepID=UPI000428006E|nr:hypothetical protein [Spirochaeta cellobiosiphila]